MRKVVCLFVRLFLESNTSALLFGQIFIVHAAGIFDDFVLILALYRFCDDILLFPLVTWLKALGASRKKK